MENKINLVFHYMGQHYKKVNFNHILNKYTYFLPVKSIRTVTAFMYDKPFGKMVFNCNYFV